MLAQLENNAPSETNSNPRIVKKNSAVIFNKNKSKILALTKS